MKTYLDCIPCFFRQAIEASRMVGFSSKKQKRVVDELARTVPRLSLKLTPPEVARQVNNILQKHYTGRDMYAGIKRKSNKLALCMYGKLKSKVACAEDKLLAAVTLAVVGNVIDYGAKNHLDVDAELIRMLDDKEEIVRKESKLIFNYKEFKRSLRSAKTILYLADNAGETVFDRVLIEEIKRFDRDKEIIYAVKEKPAINDALKEDALVSGIDGAAKIISSGSDAPGTVLSLCSEDFLALYRKADMVISKGQGNFEALSQATRPVFFLFMAKCPVIAGHVGCRIGDILLFYHRGRKTG